MVPLTLSGALTALLGGALIGLAATLLWWSHGRIAGISGVLGHLAEGDPQGRDFRGSFLVGLLLAGALFRFAAPHVFGTDAPQYGLAALSGLLVGFGTRMGSGCTSGHGVCGISRLSARSAVATVTFIATGALGVLVLRAL